MERDYRATMERIKANIKGLMQEMEGALVAEQILFYSLRRKWTKAETIWSQYVELYDQLCSVTHENPNEQDPIDFANFQRCYIMCMDELKTFSTRSKARRKLASRRSRMLKLFDSRPLRPSRKWISSPPT